MWKTRKTYSWKKRERYKTLHCFNTDILVKKKIKWKGRQKTEDRQKEKKQTKRGQTTDQFSFSNVSSGLSQHIPSALDSGLANSRHIPSALHSGLANSQHIPSAGLANSAYTQTLLVFVIILKCILFLCHLLLVSTFPLFLLTSSHLLFSSQIQRAHFHEILFQSCANSILTPILHASQNHLNFVVFFFMSQLSWPPHCNVPSFQNNFIKKKATE